MPHRQPDSVCFTRVTYVGDVSIVERAARAPVRVSTPQDVLFVMHEDEEVLVSLGGV